MAILTDSKQVTLGNAIMITVEGEVIGGSTSHSLSISPEYTEVQVKEGGQTPWKVLSKVGWEITCDALYTDSFSTLLDYATHDDEVDVVFGTIDSGKAKSGWATDSSAPAITSLLSKKAKISSLQVTAAAGDNATLSVTLTGTESLYEERQSGTGS